MNKPARIKRFDKSLPLPAYKTPGAAACDLAARETVVIAPHATLQVPLNVALEIPPGHFVLLAARSSLYKKGLAMANGIGIIDPDYCGDEDEYRAVIENHTDKNVVIERGERIAQIAVVPFVRVEWEEVDHLGNVNRGGFGTTGKR